MEGEKILYYATIVFLMKESNVLLGEKTRGIGKGRLNAPGGGIEKGEDVRESGVREVFEETGTKILSEDMKKLAVVYFHNIRDGIEKFICECHVFGAEKWEGEPKDTEELINQRWFDKNNLPVDKMMAADREWIPKVMEGHKIVAHAYIGENQAILVKPTEIEYVSSFSEDKK